MKASADSALQRASDTPDGWTWATIADVCSKVQDGTHFSPKDQTREGDFKYITAKNIKVWGLDLADVTYVPKEVHRAIYSRCNPEKGDVLYIKDGATTGIATVNPLEEEFSLLSSVALLKPIRACLDSQFLKWYLNSPSGFDAMTGQMTGCAITRIILKTIRQSPVPIAPLPEQKRIVAKVEELLSRVSAARVRLARVPALLKRFRQSVLSAACSGQLTADWREGHDAHETGDALLERIRRAGGVASRNPEPILDVDVGNVPDGWATTTIGFLAEPSLRGKPYITSGSRGWADLVSDSGPFFIRSENINTDYLRLADAIHVRPPPGAEADRTLVKSRDVLLTITGNNVGKTAVVPPQCPPAHVSQHVAIIRIAPLCEERYVWLWLRSIEHGQGQLRSFFYGYTKPGLNLDQVKSVWLALPPLDEQREIVRRVEALFALADKIEARVGAATARVEKITQAVLAKAFRGELVPTEAELARQEGRDYEPASVLLDRIRAARSDAPKPARAAPKRRHLSRGVPRREN